MYAPRTSNDPDVEVELTLGEEAVLATLTAERPSGRVGTWAELGRASAELRLPPLRPLQHA